MSEAIEVANRMRTTINAIDVDNMHCTASIGIAANKSSASVEELIEHADQAMYAAKDAGRDAIKTYF